MNPVGTFFIDEVWTFYAQTRRVDTGNVADASPVPSYRVYEEETGTPILTGNMALLDDTNTIGFYSEQITFSTANGFEAGKCYAVRVQATINAIVDATVYQVLVRAPDPRIDTLLTDLASAEATLLAAITALNDLTAGQVKDQVVEAIAGDTYDEPGQGTPLAAISLAEKLNYLYKSWRNPATQGSSQYSLYNDAGNTVDQKASVSEAGGTTSTGKIVTGP